MIRKMLMRLRLGRHSYSVSKVRFPFSCQIVHAIALQLVLLNQVMHVNDQTQDVDPLQVSQIFRYRIQAQIAHECLFPPALPFNPSCRTW